MDKAGLLLQAVKWEGTISELLSHVASAWAVQSAQ